MKNIERYVEDIAEMMSVTDEETGDLVCKGLYLNIFWKRCHASDCAYCPFHNANTFIEWAMSENH